MNWTVGMTEAKSKLAELVGQAKYGGRTFILERRGQPMAVLIGVDEFAKKWGTLVHYEVVPDIRL